MSLIAEIEKTMLFAAIKRMADELDATNARLEEALAKLSVVNGVADPQPMIAKGSPEKVPADSKEEVKEPQTTPPEAKEAKAEPLHLKTWADEKAKEPHRVPEGADPSYIPRGVLDKMRKNGWSDLHLSVLRRHLRTCGGWLGLNRHTRTVCHRHSYVRHLQALIAVARKVGMVNGNFVPIQMILTTPGFPMGAGSLRSCLRTLNNMGFVNVTTGANYISAERNGGVATITGKVSLHPALQSAN